MGTVSGPSRVEGRGDYRTTGVVGNEGDCDHADEDSEADAAG